MTRYLSSRSRNGEVYCYLSGIIILFAHELVGLLIFFIEFALAIGALARLAYLSVNVDDICHTSTNLARNDVTWDNIAEDVLVHWHVLSSKRLKSVERMK